MSHVAIHTRMHLTASDQTRQSDACLYTVKYCFICMYLFVQFLLLFISVFSTSIMVENEQRVSCVSLILPRVECCAVRSHLRYSLCKIKPFCLPATVNLTLKERGEKYLSVRLLL